MTDIMSQDEINALLDAVASAPIDEGDSPAEPVVVDGRDVRPRIHDFERPDVFSDDDIALMTEVFRSVCDGIESSLGPRAGITLDRESIALDQLSTGEFTASLPSPTLCAAIGLEPLPLPFVLEIMPGLACALLDTLAGRPVRDVSVNTGFTPAEGRAALDPFGEIAGALCAAFGRVANLEPIVRGVYSDLRRAAPCHEKDMGMSAVVAARIDYVEGLFSFFFPRLALWPVLREAGEAPPDGCKRIIDIPLRVRAATFAQARKLGPSSRVEIDTMANPLAAIAPPGREE